MSTTARKIPQTTAIDETSSRVPAAGSTVYTASTVFRFIILLLCHDLHRRCNHVYGNTVLYVKLRVSDVPLPAGTWCSAMFPRRPAPGSFAPLKQGIGIKSIIVFIIQYILTGIGVAQCVKILPIGFSDFRPGFPPEHVK